MMIVSRGGNVCAPDPSAATPRAFRRGMGMLLLLPVVAVLSGVTLPNLARAAEPSTTDAAMADRIQALIPDIEAYITRAG